ncbi:hypothetical protein ANCDUO_05206 [Ancylostoma duodenale]|uniref:Uncharacterized protein n=1 Tax=Ancylostoma duodenale TaxID=51022 RepID=A0A0C2GZ75_9BILA|nr:hypothetical protein ANCDUO_05206 [Ancylostoma duodenale]
MAQPSRKSYVHGCSQIPLLFETVGERLRNAVDQIQKVVTLSKRFKRRMKEKCPSQMYAKNSSVLDGKDMGGPFATAATFIVANSFGEIFDIH